MSCNCNCQMCTKDQKYKRNIFQTSLYDWSQTPDVLTPLQRMSMVIWQTADWKNENKKPYKSSWMSNWCCLLINNFHSSHWSVFTGPKISTCVPGMARLLKLIDSRSQYFNGIDITHLCWCYKNIPASISSIPPSPSLPVSITPPLLCYFPLYLFLYPHISLSLCPFFSYHGWAETPPCRWCWFSPGHRWPWGTQKHSDQCGDMITPEVCLSSVGSRWCGQPHGQLQWSAALLFDLSVRQEFKYTYRSTIRL